MINPQSTGDLVPFNYQDTEVRTVLIGSEPWFVAADVARVLGYRESYYLTRRLDDEDKGPRMVGTPGGDQEMTVISEAGFYAAILGSQVEQARAVKRWLTHEVLPTIRKTGSYGVAVPDLETSEGRVLMLERALATERELITTKAELAVAAPKADLADRILDADGDLSVADTAKSLTRAGIKVGPTRLFNLLSGMGWITRAGDGRWRVKQRFIETGYMSVLPQSHYHPRTGVLVLDPPQPRVTPKGMARLLADHGGSSAAVSA